MILLPLLRPLRLLRLVALLNVLNRRVVTRPRGRLAVYVAGGAALHQKLDLLADPTPRIALEYLDASTA